MSSWLLRGACPVRALLVRRQLESTNDAARAWAAARPQDLPLVVLAERQTRGRGRGDHRWWSGAGALTVSVAGAGEAAPLLPLQAASAIADSIDHWAGQAIARLKWPNDVWIEGQKVAGILIESMVDPTPAFVVGIGVNLNGDPVEWHPQLARTATSLAARLGRTLPPMPFFDRLLDDLRRRTAQLGDRMLADVRGRCALTGRWVEVTQGPRTRRGRCRGIAENGALQVAFGDRAEDIASATVRVVEDDMSAEPLAGDAGEAD